MSAKVFLSYASADQDLAQKFYSVLERLNVRCFFAPTDIRAGENWPQRLATEIPQCSVFLLLWSRAAAESTYVPLEIKVALESKLYLAPVELEANAEKPIFLANAHFSKYGILGVEGIAETIHKHLLVSSAPYPLSRLYQEIIQSELDFSLHLEATRLLMRFIALVQVAGYTHLKKRSDALNRKIEEVLPLQSLFADFDLAQDLASWLDLHGALIDESLREFLRLPIHRVPGAREFMEDDDAADAFDRKHLHQLTGGRDDLGEGSTLPREQAEKILCHGMRDFMRQALGTKWSSACQLFACLPGSGSDRKPLIEPLTEPPADGTRIFLDLAGRMLDLSPFFLLVRSGRVWEAGIHRWQDNTKAEFTPVTTKPRDPTVSPPVSLPWGRVEIKRSLPNVVYAGEVHRATLEIINHSHDAVSIAAIEESLPENLTSGSGTGSVRVAVNLDLAAGARLELGYPIRGTNTPGLRRTYGETQVQFFFRGETSSTSIGGDSEVLVQSVAEPRLIVSRQIFNRRGERIFGRVALDSILSVEVEIRSGGASRPDVRLDEEFEGGVLVAGSKTLYSGTIGRLDLQQPIQTSYQLRVSGKNFLVIRGHATSTEEAIAVDGAEMRLGIDEMAPPRIDLRWERVIRKGSNVLEADLRVENTGGTAAHEFTLVHWAPADIKVFMPGTIPGQVEAGQNVSFRIRIEYTAVASASVRFEIVYGSITGQSFEDSLLLDLNRVIDRKFTALPVVGRAEAREQVRAALTEPDTVVFTLHGPKGVGKGRILLDEIDRLKQEGRQVLLYEQDSGMSDSFAEAVAALFERIVFSEALEHEKGSEQAMKEFLRRSGMDDQQYGGYLDHLKALIYRSGKPHHGTWRAIEMLLTKMTRTRNLNRVVLLFRSVSQFAKAELEGLSALRQYLTPPRDVRIILTCHDPLKVPYVDREIGIGLPTPEECRELIERVFVMPRASSLLVQDLIEKSDQVPSTLISLLLRMTEKDDGLLDFSNPVSGVRIHDRTAFENLPTSLLESERKIAAQSGIQPAVLACVAAFHGPFTAEIVAASLRKLGQDPGAPEIEESLQDCQKHHWLQPSGNKLEVVSSTIRAALRGAVPNQLMEDVNQAIFSASEEQGASLDVCFPHLVEAPVAFVAENGVQLISGLQSLVISGRFSQVRAILARLRHAQLKMDASRTLELELIEQELRWEETEDVNQETVQSILSKLREVGNRKHRAFLKTRLCLLASKWWSKRGQDYAKGAAIAESAETWLFRTLPIDDLSLKFEFYLNLWDIYYHLLNEKKFRKIDRWIWKRLETKRNDHYDSYAIAKFLGLFLECQRQFDGPEARYAYFSVPYTDAFGQSRPIRENIIEAATRTERIRSSFLDQFLRNPDALNQKNVVVLGRLYLDLGIALWKESRTLKGLASHEGDAESYMIRAENLFADAGFILDLAHARAMLGDVYVERIRLVEITGDKTRLVEWYALAAKWLQLAARDFEEVGAREEACLAWEEYADVACKWAAHQNDRIEDAIAAFEHLVAVAEVAARPEKRDASRLTLVGLYEKTGRLEAATRILGEMEVQTDQVMQLRAHIDAQALMKGSVVITMRNVANFVQDISTLRFPHPVSGEGATQAGTNAKSVEALAVISWNLANYYAEQKEGIKALSALREARRELASASALSEKMQAGLPLLLPNLWQMEGTADDQMTQDFSNLLLPRITEHSRPAAERMLGKVWSSDAIRIDGPHFAAADMTLVLCEWSLDHGSSPQAEASLAKKVLRRLLELNVWERPAVARICGRAFAVALRGGEPSSDETILDELTKLIELLKQKNLYGAALRILVHLFELLLEAYRKTQNSWYFDIIRQLSPHLTALQNLSENDFEEITHLIRLYLQLPDRLTDAVDLMEKQCQHLVNQHDYKLLPNYLSFLSDLLGDVLRRDSAVERLLKLADKGLGRDQEIPGKRGERERTTTVRAVATQLCGRVIGEIRKQEIQRRVEGTVLYNAAKLLDRRAMADLSAAIYSKLYDLADRADGACVWAVYNAWLEGAHNSEDLSLEDSIAVTAYANCENETDDGGFAQNPRNYMINAGARNHLVQRLAHFRPWDPELSLTYAELEIRRLSFLTGFIDHIQEFLGQLGDFERMAWVTFLHHHVAPDAEDGPFWQKLQRIESQREDLQNQIFQLAQEVERRGVWTDFTQTGLSAFSYRAQQYLVDSRRRGKEIMSQLAARIRPFLLEEILGEVQAHLEGRERAIDFRAVLGLWSRQESGAEESEEIEPFLDRDPRSLLKPLVENASRLIGSGEPALAERMYRYALSLCGGLEIQGDPNRSMILRGLGQSLMAQGKNDAAGEIATAAAGA